MRPGTRTRTSSTLEQEFKIAFTEALGQRLDPPQQFNNISNQELCSYYDQLPHSRKRGIWPQVAAKIGKNEKWAAKHYLNSFRRALFPDQLSTEDKHEITEIVRREMATG